MEVTENDEKKSPDSKNPEAAVTENSNAVGSETSEAVGAKNSETAGVETPEAGGSENPEAGGSENPDAVGAKKSKATETANSRAAGAKNPQEAGAENLEEVESTLERIRDEKKRGDEPSTFSKVMHAVAYPFMLPIRGIRFLMGKIRIPITVKTMIIYTLLFTIALVLIDVFTISSVFHHLEADAAYKKSLIITSVLLVIIAVAVVAALGNLICRSMLSPIRKMVRRIDSISADDLTTRLDDVDSQDELRELTERINAMLDKLEMSFDRQKKFVSDASHELKTPISVIQGYSNLLMRWGKNDPGVLDESIESIAREADNMKRIVEQLLLLAKMGQYMVTEEEFDLGEQLASIVASYRLTVKDRAFVFEAEKKVVARSDKSLLTECVRALTDNAIKYSDAGSAVELALTTSGGYAEISVADHGIGISEEDLPHVFDRFYRCDRARKRDSNSSGLGLTIARSLMEMLGGTIRAESTPGVGSVFTLRFPLGEKKPSDHIEKSIHAFEKSGRVG